MAADPQFPFKVFLEMVRRLLLAQIAPLHHTRPAQPMAPKAAARLAARARRRAAAPAGSNIAGPATAAGDWPDRHGAG